MKRMMMFMLCAAVLLGSGIPVSTAEDAKQSVIDVGNRQCPVMGGAVNGTDFVEYNGKRYALCCPGCKGTFLTNPEKYAAIAEADAKA